MIGLKPELLTCLVLGRSWNRNLVDVCARASSFCASMRIPGHPLHCPLALSRAQVHESYQAHSKVKRLAADFKCTVKCR
jgi:hypothetical protein